MTAYEHTQPGTYVRVWVGILLSIFGTLAAILWVNGEQHAAISFCLPIVLCVVMLSLFHSMTVRVSPNDVVLSLGIGLITKGFLIDDIETASIVRNRWYHGWGIKRIRGGWLYGVSGFDAVELRLKNGRKYRIGTNEPAELLAAIEAATTNA